MAYKTNVQSSLGYTPYNVMYHPLVELLDGVAKIDEYTSPTEYLALDRHLQHCCPSSKASPGPPRDRRSLEI